MSALPVSTLRQLFALVVLAIAVVIGARHVSLLLRGTSTAGHGIGWRPPPDLSALCVLRI
jgi:hypothetical protein